jgi:hypothetical protein
MIPTEQLKIVNEQCKGCISYNRRDNDCRIVSDQQQYIEKCPCFNCLIKSMCVESCRPLDVAVSIIYNKG